MKKRILIIDDEQNVLNAMKRTLKGFNDEFEVHTNTHSKNTLDLIKELDIDLLISDIFMPERNGIEVMEEVRKQFPSIKIIAISGSAAPYLEHAELLGTTSTLSKPFTNDELIAAINSAFQE